MIDLERQIREYYEHIVVPVAPDEIGITTGDIDATTSVPTPRRFNRPVVVVAAAAAVLLLIGLPLWLIGGTETAPPATERPEMLQIGDLPQRFDWQVYDETQDGTGEIGVWNVGWHGLIAVRCTEEEPTGPAYSTDGENWVGFFQDFDDPELHELGEVWQHRALYAEENTPIVNLGTTHVIGEVVFAESPAAEPGVFDALEAEIIGCVDDQDRWSAATDRGWEVGRVPMTPTGDGHAAGKWKIPLGSRSIDLFRLAIVRIGPQLLLVESHEFYANSEWYLESLDSDPAYVSPLTDSEFAAIVEAAVNRLVATTDEARLIDGS